MSAPVSKDGWVKDYRSKLDWPWFRIPNAAHLWEYVLLKASHQARRAAVGNIGIDLEAGQFVFGRHAAAEETGLSEQEVRTALLVLQREGCLKCVVHPTKQFCIVTVCNWDTYQGQNGEANQAPTRLQPGVNQGSTTDKGKTNQPFNQAPTIVTVGNWDTYQGQNGEANQPFNQASTRLQPGSNQAPTTDKNVKNGKNVENVKKEEETASAADAAKGPAESNGDADTKPKRAAKRKPNPYWDAVVSVWGLHVVTETDRKRVGKLARDFKAKCQAVHAGPDEIKARHKALASKWGDPGMATPEALCKWWDSLKPPPQSQSDAQQEQYLRSIGFFDDRPVQRV